MLAPALKLGTTVVKTALKLWVGDIPFASDIGATSADLLGDRVSNAMDRRKLERRFDDFGDTIAQRVIDQLGQEFGNLPDNEREAAVLAVTDSFDQAQLADRALFDQDLDPLYLEQHIRSKNPRATRDLGEAATAVYDRLLPECCAYAIATATSLPSFNSDAFTELLRRDTMILERLDQILRHLPKHSVSDGQGKEAEFTTAYRRKAAERWDRLELFGTDTQTRTYPLSLAYLSLNVTLPPKGMDMDGDRQDWDQDERASGLQTVEAALAGNPLLFLRGAAGSGKTTLLHWIAVRASRKDFPSALEDWNGLVPFFLPLRRYVGEQLPDPEEFIRPTGSYLQKSAPNAWVHRLLDEGQALLLIDGVDELPRDEREAARRWLRELLTEYPHCRYVVTSRPAAVGEGWLARQGFTSAEVQPLRDDDVRAFIRYWHGAVRSEVIDEEERCRLERYESELTSKVLGQRHLRNIAATPLLCALLCALYRDRRTALPRDRIEVYQAALAMLLTDRDEQRGIPADGPSMSLTEKTQLLQELAKWLIINGSSDAPRETAQRRIERLLAIMHRVNEKPEEVFEHLMLRSGVLTSPAVDRVAFVHRTFEEYLAARALVEEDSLPLLIKHAHDDQWHEVVVMAAGQATQRQRESLIRGLLERADSVKKHSDRLQIVALACLETSTTLSPRLHSEIQSRVRSLMPPRTEAQVKAIITTGEAAIPLLREAEVPDARAAAATIRAAAGVGGEQSIPIIANALQAPRHPTRSILVNTLDAWEANPTQEFAEQILPLYPSACAPTFATHGDALDIATRYAPHLHSILIKGGNGTELAHLQQIERLVTLILTSDEGTWHVDFSEIAEHMGSLDQLQFNNNASLSDASPLHHLPLRTLKIWRPEQTQRADEIRGMGTIQTLIFNGNLPVPPMNEVAPPILKRLAIHQNKEINSITHFLDLTGLEIESLIFYQTPNMYSIRGIEEMETPLREFHLIGRMSTQIDLTPLANLNTLHLIELDFDILIHSKTTLTSINNLTEIHVNYNEKTSSPLRLPVWLRDIAGLRQIHVWGQKMLDVSSLSGMPGVTIWRPPIAPKKVIGAEKLGPGSRVVRAPRPRY